MFAEVGRNEEIFDHALFHEIMELAGPKRK